MLGAYVVSKYIANPSIIVVREEEGGGEDSKVVRVTEKKLQRDIVLYYIGVRDEKGSYTYRITKEEYEAVSVGDRWGLESSKDSSAEEIQ